mgnify:CR=1 FL=1|jgi:hypothetical protein
MKLFNFLITTLLLICLNTISAQVDLGGNPNNLNWQIITSPSVRVIYPDGMDLQAQRIAAIINHMDSTNRISIGLKKRRLDLVLQNQTINPNGYVALAPFRSEFYATPPASNLFLGSINWLDVLSIHEYRHALQYMNTKRGITNLVYIAQGESGWSFMNSLSIPNWYFEGDAVITETALSLSGRGRSPFFTLEQRALANANKNYSYSKNRNNSYKDLVPDHYRLGYMMLTKLRNEKGNSITANILQDAATFKSVIYPFSFAMKKQTGYTTWNLYKSAWEDQKNDFTKQLDSIQLIPTINITPKSKNTYTDYRFPVEIEKDKILARKSSYKTTDEIILLENISETRVTTIGFNNDDWFNYRDGILTWTEINKNSRRSNQDFSNIVIYDLKTKKKNYITKKSKYFSPSISPDKSKIAAIYISPNQKNEIHILDIKTGDVIQKIETASNYFLSRTSWDEDGNSIITIAKNNSKLALIRLSLLDESIIELTSWTSHTMEAPVVKKDKVYFNAGFSGIDNIYYTDISGTKRIFQVSSVPIGAFEPNLINENEIIFTEFTEMGYVISKQNLTSDNSLLPIKIIEPSLMPQYQTTANNNEGGTILNTTFSNMYPAKPYNALFKGMKLHSWGLTPSISNPGFAINVSNLLRDVELELGATMNRNENNAIGYNASLKIARYYPTFTFTLNQINRDTYYIFRNKLTVLQFNETKIGTEVGVPLSWKKGNFRTSLEPIIGGYYSQLSNIKGGGFLFQNENFLNYKAGFKFSTLKRLAYQNLGSRLGFALSTNYFKAQNSEKIIGNTKLFLPGISQNHNLVLTAGYQKENLKNPYQQSDTFEYPRGFNTPVNDQFTIYKADYTLPIAYPDFGALGIVYFKRISANLFYDYGIGKRNLINRETIYNSTGYELIFETKMLNSFPLSIGIRQSFLLTNDPFDVNRKSSFGLLLSTLF